MEEQREPVEHTFYLIGRDASLHTSPTAAWSAWEQVAEEEYRFTTLTFDGKSLKEIDEFGIDSHEEKKFKKMFALKMQAEQQSRIITEAQKKLEDIQLKLNNL